MSRLAIAIAALVVGVGAMPVQAGEPTPPSTRSQGEAEQALREGVDSIFRALNSLMRSVPQYEMPELQDNGDIIIRRKKRHGAPQQRAPRVNEPSWT